MLERSVSGRPVQHHHAARDVGADDVSILGENSLHLFLPNAYVGGDGS